MSAAQVRNTAKILLLLYIGYFGCVSYFIHTHIYNGVMYVHSHPYKKWTNDADDKQPPFETHHHTAAGFFTLNQLSNTVSYEADGQNHFEKVKLIPLVVSYNEYILNNTINPSLRNFNLRAPPYFPTI